MLRPDVLQKRLQEWADTEFPNRTQASERLAKMLGVSASTARGYIDYRVGKATYETAYAVWHYLADERASS